MLRFTPLKQGVNEMVCLVVAFHHQATAGLKKLILTFYGAL